MDLGFRVVKKKRVRAQNLLGFEEFYYYFLWLFDREEHGVLIFFINKRKDLTWGSKKEGKSRNLVFKGCMNIIYEQYHTK